MSGKIGSNPSPFQGEDRHLVDAPDLTGDGNDDVLAAMADGYARLYDGISGIQVEGFPPIPAKTDIAFLPD